MKIGILTFHNVPNYGAALQAFALKKYLTKLGNTVSVIDFQCPGNDSTFLPENQKKNFTASANPIKRILKDALYSINIKKDYAVKWAKFENFAKEHFNISPDEIKGFDVVFCGSDQIWNPEITKGFKSKYFGIETDDKTISASYAASCGDITEFSDEQISEFLALIKNLDFIGVREKSLCEALKENGIDALCTIDPTFLLSSEDYIKQLNLTKTEKPKYLLQYALQNTKELDEAAAEIAKNKGLKIIKICGYAPLKSKGKGIFDAGVQEFLQYLYNAEYVVTNSFHGVALSLIFKKDFTSSLPKMRKGRITDLLESLSLQDRIFKDKNNIVTDKVNYDIVGEKLSDMILYSTDYIEKVLRNVNG